MKYRIDVNEGLAPEYVLVAIDEDYDVNPGKEQPLFVCNNWKVIEIIKSERSVIICGRQHEAVIHQRLLP